MEKTKTAITRLFENYSSRKLSVTEEEALRFGLNRHVIIHLLINMIIYNGKIYI